MKISKAYQSIRKTWGELNPVTRVVKDKKRYDRNVEKRKNHED